MSSTIAPHRFVTDLVTLTCDLCGRPDGGPVHSKFDLDGIKQFLAEHCSAPGHSMCDNWGCDDVRLLVAEIERLQTDLHFQCRGMLADRDEEIEDLQAALQRVVDDAKPMTGGVFWFANLATLKMAREALDRAKCR